MPDPTPPAAHTVNLYLPWHAEADHDLGGVPYWLILDAAGLPRASGLLPEEAAVIVQAVNERETLLAALTAVVEQGRHVAYDDLRARRAYELSEDVIEQVRAALELVKGAEV